jgi:hypothetical protein
MILYRSLGQTHFDSSPCGWALVGFDAAAQLGRTQEQNFPAPGS